MLFYEGAYLHYTYIDSKMVVTLFVTVGNRTNDKGEIRQGTQSTNRKTHLAS